MAKTDKDLQQLIESRVLRMNAGVLAVAASLLAGGALFVLTMILVLKGGPNPGAHLVLLSNFMPGYAVTFWGAVIGSIEAMVYAWAVVYVGARLYNWVADQRHGRG